MIKPTITFRVHPAPMRIHNAILLVGLVLVSALLFDVVRAEADDGVKEAQKALESSGDFPWYDEETDSLAQPSLSGSRGSTVTHRDSDWERKEKAGSNRTANTNAASTFSTLATVFFWIVVIVLFAALVGFLIWAFMKQETSIHHDDVEDWLQDTRTDEQRIEDLPFEIKQPKSDLLAAALAARDRGDHRQAIIYLFSYMLIRLDRAHLIRLAKGKTNRQYLGELPAAESARLTGQSSVGLGPVVERTMVMFERVFFGDHDPQSTEFNECWNGLDDFHQLVEANQK